MPGISGYVFSCLMPVAERVQIGHHSLSSSDPEAQTAQSRGTGTAKDSTRCCNDLGIPLSFCNWLDPAGTCLRLTHVYAGLRCAPAAGDIGLSKIWRSETHLKMSIRDPKQSRGVNLPRSCLQAPDKCPMDSLCRKLRFRVFAGWDFC